MARLALLLGSMGLALFVGEAVARMAELGPQLLRLDVRGRESAFRLSDNPVLGYEMKPDFRPGERRSGTSFRTNSHGLRDVERSLEKHGPRILLLGDSVVQGIRSDDLEDTIGRRLERLLADRGVEVLNFGTSGYNTRAEAELLAVKGVGFDPDLVLLIFVSNDHNEKRGDLVGQSTYQRPRWVNWLLDHSRLFRGAAYEWNLFRVGLDAQARSVHDEALPKNPVKLGLEHLKTLSEEHGFQLCIALWPSFDDERVYYKSHMYRKAGDELLLVEFYAQHLGITTHRLLGAFEQDAADHGSEGESLITRYTGGDHLDVSRGDGMHPNDLASQIVAEALRDLLVAHPEMYAADVDRLPR